ncbi:hypothetical protein [Paenibacillus mesotrionivorans]|jgi:hypothetical protein|uniref:Uncharacterized protein n=1 Tax=Paenibacillus mesotrionivorans TaxID=3160968 RepID=A0ACC7NZ49_9BACL
MTTHVLVPQGEERITVELTVKEAMALSGFRFNQNSGQLADARRKVRSALDSQVMKESDIPLLYEELTH